MCGRFVLRRLALIRAAMDAMPKLPFDEFTERPRYNIAPSQQIPIVQLDASGSRVLADARWGFIPHWTKGKPKAQPINARAETVSTSGMFRQAFARRRCIIPADGFYEWKKLDEKNKQPTFIHFPDDRIFGFAGLWEQWKPDDADPIDTCTIITTTPNAVAAQVHDRMPVILRPEDYAAWLSRDTPPEEAAQLMRPYPDGELEAVPVSSAVNNPRHDAPDNIAPV